MSGSTESVSDERFACSLLMDHLTRIGEADFRCDVNTDDPPDFIVTWEGGERWGVEVTRGYQQVKAIGEAAVVSSETVTAFLKAFADDLAKDTEEKRRLNYILYLEGPGPFVNGSPPYPDEHGKKKRRSGLRPILLPEAAPNSASPEGISSRKGQEMAGGL